MILAYAGYRLDADDRAEPRFPAAAVPLVRTQVAELLEKFRPAVVVGAAAAGSDLILLAEAQRASIPTRIVLPLAIAEFRKRSVEDHDKAWGLEFDRLIEECADITLGQLELTDDWYLQGNDLILDTATEVADGTTAMAVVVAAPEDGESATSDFAQKALARGWTVIHIDPTR